jgi:hypothetical protein
MSLLVSTFTGNFGTGGAVFGKHGSNSGSCLFAVTRLIRMKTSALELFNSTG